MTKLTKAEKQARWVATPVAKVIRPLKYIRAQTMIEEQETVGGPILRSDSFEYKTARLNTHRGNGEIVQRFARQLAIQQAGV